MASLQNLTATVRTPWFLRLHFLIALLILSQIINSNATGAEYLAGQGFRHIITWIHVLSGMMLMVLGPLLFWWMLHTRGIRFYFAWALGEFDGLLTDFRSLMLFRLPDARSGGLAAMVQGLGVLALLAVSASGVAWFVAGYFTLPAAGSFLHLHKFLTTFVEIYFYAHGAMGVLHYLYEHRRKPYRSDGTGQR